MTVTVDDVHKIRDQLVAEGKSGEDLVRGVRTLVHAAFQAENPPPGPEAVTDAHRIECDFDSTTHRGDMVPEGGYRHGRAHHWLQKKHGIDLWKRSDALVAEAGVK